MKILVLTQQYPKAEDLYRNSFVHTRIKSYKKLNPNNSFTVFVPACKKDSYSFDEISVIEGGKKQLKNILNDNDLDIIVVHFLTFNMVNSLLKYAQKTPKFIWVHGYEALSWKRRLFNAVSPRFLKYIIGNIIQLNGFKKFAKNEQNSHYIFVSNWMKEIAEKDLAVSFSKNSIIPNGINLQKYSFGNDKVNYKKNVLLIRSFNSRKYATDIAIESILEFSKTNSFHEYHFTIVGEGRYFKNDIKKISHFENITIINSFLNSNEIKDLHDKHGIFLCPTRQDAQGVSMCEAMSSGLVPVTSKNTAIPEFVSDGVDGILTTSPKEIAEALYKLGSNESYFIELSKNARNKMQEICDLEKITIKEINLIEKN